MGMLHRKGQPDLDDVESAQRCFLYLYANQAPGLLGGLLDLLPVYPVDDESPIWVGFWGAFRHEHPQPAEAILEWARTFHLTFRNEPADWAMNTALDTLHAWATSRRRFVCVFWADSAGLLPEDFPAEFPIKISIPPWNRPGCETEQQFKERFDAACTHVFHEHVREAKEWTKRATIEERRYIDALAMWQAGWRLSEIHKTLRLNVGRDPGDSDYNSAISKGIDRIAKLIQLDRRPVPEAECIHQNSSV
jgi:hypothetical protein